MRKILIKLPRLDDVTAQYDYTDEDYICVDVNVDGRTTNMILGINSYVKKGIRGVYILDPLGYMEDMVLDTPDNSEAARFFLLNRTINNDFPSKYMWSYIP